MFLNKPKFYTKCKTLPLSVFIEIILTGNVDLLTTKGRPKLDQISEAWNEILHEYGKLTDSPEYKAGMETLKSFAYLQSKAMAVGTALQILHYKVEPQAVDILKRAGYDFAFDIENPVQYFKDLDLIGKKIKAIQIQLEQRLKEVQAMSEEDTATEQNWMDSVATLSKFMGFRIDPKETTVLEYIGYQRQLMAHNKAIENEQLKKEING